MESLAKHGSACGWNGVGLRLACYDPRLRKINFEAGVVQHLRERSLAHRSGKRMTHVSGRTETVRGGATCALGEVESSSANEVSEMGPRFPHSDSQIFRF